MDLGKYTKAILGGLVAAYAVFQIARGELSPAGNGVTLDEWVDILATLVFVGLGVWAVPNTPPKPTTSTSLGAPSRSPVFGSSSEKEARSAETVKSTLES